MGPLIILVGILALASIYVVTVLRRQDRSRRSLPPGPPGLPLVNNLFDIPSHSEWIAYKKWGHQFNSDIIHIKILNSHVIVLNTAAAAAELLEKRSSIYSDRPWLIMLDELCDFGRWNLAFLPYGPAWRATRAHFRLLAPDKIAQWHPQQIEAARIYARSLLQAPDEFIEHTRLLVGSNILNITYGIRASSRDDPWITLVEMMNHIATVTANPGSYLVDTMPILKHIPSWFPGARFQREAREWRIISHRVCEEPFEHTKNALRNDGQNESIAAQLLSDIKSKNGDRGADETTAKWAMAIMYGAGADTSSSALECFLLAMALHPEVQIHAQEELDTILRQGRLPEFSDELPYVTAVMKESLRWNSVTPLGVPHRVTQDDVAFGFHIPGGSTVVANIWAILHEEVIYPEPFRFNPTRFLGPDPNPDPTAAFGFGRRICPGRHLAIETVWITIATVLACFDITKVQNPDGTVDEPQVKYTSGFLSHPEPFRCVIKPRSVEAENLIRASEA